MQANSRWQAADFGKISVFTVASTKYNSAKSLQHEATVVEVTDSGAQVLS